MRVQRTTLCVCRTCDRPFSVPTHEAKRGGGTYCGRQCYYAKDRPADAERFWSKVSKDGPIQIHVPELGPCWIWIGARRRDGYGAFRFNGRTHYAHVVAYVLEHGWPPPETPEVTHLCDGGNMGCVRPDHLKPDTHAGNFAGGAARGRFRRA